nr:RNA-directed DNA polymerase, eukaryota [Tanacetum cinerariifolium]
AIEPLNNNDNEEEFDDEYASDVNEVPAAFGENASSNLRSNDSVKVSQKGINNGGSVLGVMEDVIRVGQAMGYSMEGC